MPDMPFLLPGDATTTDDYTAHRWPRIDGGMLLPLCGLSGVSCPAYHP